MVNCSLANGNMELTLLLIQFNQLLNIYYGIFNSTYDD